jgi:pimeloyl-ACP methyl ester carboxylesterase
MRLRTGLAAASATVVAVTLVTMPVSAEPDEPGTPITGQEYKGSPWQREAAKLPDAGRSRPAAASMLSVTPKVALDACDDDPEWLCGTIPVPIDRSRPHGRTLDLAFMVLPHSDPSSTVKDGLFASDGGPGSSNTFADHRNFLRFLLRDLTDKRDLVVVDHRGTGQSDAINCPQLQRIIGDFDAEPSSVIRAIGRCGRSMGPDADRYGSGDIAKDLDAVRRALGYQKISIYGLSYAGTFLSAYASRFSDHVRALVIDAGTPSTDPGHAWTWGYDIPPAMADVVGLECMRAPACAAAQPRADSALARLAAALRRQPISGTVNVSGVGRRHVVANEFNLITSAGDVLNQAELAAVEQARERGDTAPLLRMIGENDLAAFEPAPPSEDSAGDNAAAFCNDQDFVWNRSDPVPLRRTKYQAALHALGPDAFMPFSPRAWTQHFLSNYCVQWPAPDRFTPAVPKGAVVTGVPTLILSGDLDTVVPTGITDELLRLFPEATFLRVAGAAHPSAGWSECADVLMMGFLRTLHTSGDCDEPGFVASATSQFPKYARTAAPAEPGVGDQSTTLDRKVVTAAVLAVRDAWLRSFRVPTVLGSVTGLRGGSADFDYQSVPGGAVIDLHGVRFTRDVAVSGSTDLKFAPNDMTMQLSVDGPRQVDGSLDVTGKLGFGNPFADFVVTGTVHGHHVHLTVPAN